MGNQSAISCNRIQRLCRVETRVSGKPKEARRYVAECSRYLVAYVPPNSLSFDRTRNTIFDFGLLFRFHLPAEDTMDSHGEKGTSRTFDRPVSGFSTNEKESRPFERTMFNETTLDRRINALNLLRQVIKLVPVATRF